MDTLCAGRRSQKVAVVYCHLWDWAASIGLFSDHSIINVASNLCIRSKWKAKVWISDLFVTYYLTAAILFGFWSTYQLQISWIFKLIAFFKAVFFLNYISVTSSIFVNKFLQKCQNYYTLSSPKHPSGNCYVSCFLTDIAALTLLDPHFETRLTLRSFYPQTQSSADLLIIFDTFSKRTLIPLLI